MKNKSEEKIISPIRYHLIRKPVAYFLAEEPYVFLTKKSIDKEKADIEAEMKKVSDKYEAKYQESLVSINDVLIKQSYQIQKIMELLRVKNLRNERVFALEKLINKED